MRRSIASDGRRGHVLVVARLCTTDLGTVLAGTVARASPIAVGEMKASVDGALGLFLQPVKHRWPCPEHIMAKLAGPSNAENNPNTNPNPNIYTAT